MGAGSGPENYNDNKSAEGYRPMDDGRQDEGGCNGHD